MSQPLWPMKLVARTLKCIIKSLSWVSLVEYCFLFYRAYCSKCSPYTCWQKICSKSLFPIFLRTLGEHYKLRNVGPEIRFQRPSATPKGAKRIHGCLRMEVSINDLARCDIASWQRCMATSPCTLNTSENATGTFVTVESKSTMKNGLEESHSRRRLSRWFKASKQGDHFPWTCCSKFLWYSGKSFDSKNGISQVLRSMYIAAFNTRSQGETP